jgi:ketosteroid isomerase-like protein
MALGKDSQMNSQTDEALNVAMSIIDALTRRDPEGMISLMDEGIVLEVAFPMVKGENVTGSKRQTGKAVHAYAQDLKRLTKQMRFSNVIWRTTNDGLALFEADGDTILSDGRLYPNHYLMVFEVANGKVIRWRQYHNPVNAIRAYGKPLDSLP